MAAESGTDFVGIAALLTAAVNSLVLVYVTVKANQKLGEVHDLVNGLSEKRSRASRKAGRIQGADEERARPTKKK